MSDVDDLARIIFDRLLVARPGSVLCVSADGAITLAERWRGTPVGTVASFVAGPRVSEDAIRVRLGSLVQRVSRAV